MGIFTSKWERQVDNNLFSFIELEQFRNFRISTIWNYSLMWFLIILQTALYGVDIYTCVRLLAFNTWASEIKPYIPFRISKWLFAACILFSVALWIFEAIRGIRVFRTGNISLTYTNPFARRLRSVVSYDCFCVLNEINPSGGFERMSFYTYFTLRDSIKLVLADSPRQVINALTLWSVLQVDTRFWDTLKEISIYNRNVALILYGMLISFFIWIFFVAQLFFALVFTIPVYYNIHKLEFSSLRQFVCIKVDKTVKRLARKYQKESLKKNYEKFRNNTKFNYESKDNLVEKPSIPNLSSRPTDSSLQSYSFGVLSNPSSFDSIADIPPTKQYSQLNNSSRDLLSTIHEKEILKAKIQNQDKAIDPNPFRDRIIQRPMQIHPKTSTSKLVGNGEDYTRPSVYESRIKNSNSQSSLTEENFPARTVFMPPKTTAYNPYYMNSTTSLNLSVASFDDFVDTYANNADLEHNYQPYDEEDDFLFGPDESLNRNDVRPSLILRARDMEMEDYSRFGSTEIHTQYK